MLMAQPLDDTANPAHHQQVIETLAKENHAPIERVRELYETAHARLHAQARVKTFVSVIATRLVRNALHAERNSAA